MPELGESSAPLPGFVLKKNQLPGNSPAKFGCKTQNTTFPAGKAGEGTQGWHRSCSRRRKSSLVAAELMKLPQNHLKQQCRAGGSVNLSHIFRKSKLLTEKGKLFPIPRCCTSRGWNWPNKGGKKKEANRTKFTKLCFLLFEIGKGSLGNNDQV